MATERTETDLGAAFSAYYRDEVHRTRRAGARLLATREAARAHEAHPLRYDASGFPISDPRSGSADRLRRLLFG